MSNTNESSQCVNLKIRATPLTDSLIRGNDDAFNFCAFEMLEHAKKMERERSYLLENNNKVRDALDHVLSALHRLMEAEEATIEEFNAKEINQLESAMSEARKVIEPLGDDPLWLKSNTAPRDRTILAFFEDFGWYPSAWSEDDQVWKTAKCVGRKGVKTEEPEWHEITFRDDEMCWWRAWPSNRWQDNPNHSGYTKEYERMAAEIREAMANGATLSDLNTKRRVLNAINNSQRERDNCPVDDRCNLHYSGRRCVYSKKHSQPCAFEMNTISE